MGRPFSILPVQRIPDSYRPYKGNRPIFIPTPIPWFYYSAIIDRRKKITCGSKQECMLQLYDFRIILPFTQITIKRSQLISLLSLLPVIHLLFCCKRDLFKMPTWSFIHSVILVKFQSWPAFPISDIYKASCSMILRVPVTTWSFSAWKWGFLSIRRFWCENTMYTERWQVPGHTKSSRHYLEHLLLSLPCLHGHQDRWGEVIHFGLLFSLSFFVVVLRIEPRAWFQMPIGKSQMHKFYIHCDGLALTVMCDTKWGSTAFFECSDATFAFM